MKRDAIEVNGTAMGIGNAGLSSNMRDGRDGKSELLGFTINQSRGVVRPRTPSGRIVEDQLVALKPRHS